MKRLFLFITLLFVPLLSFSKNRVLFSEKDHELNHEQERKKAIGICKYLINQDLVEEEHSCHEIIDNNNNVIDEGVIDELIERGILDTEFISEGNICVEP